MYNNSITAPSFCLHNAYPATLCELTTRQVRESYLDSAALARYWAKVERGPWCWSWTSQRTPDGYGQFGIDHVPVYAHRIAWALLHGPIPVGQSVLHRCDHPWCVNPAHLFLGTHTDNMQDASAKGRLSVPRRRTRAFKAEVIRRYQAGEAPAHALAAEYGVHMLTVLRWVRATTGAKVDQRAMRRLRQKQGAA